VPQLNLSQHDRLFKIDTPFGTDKVVVRHFHGKESISGLFEYKLELISGDFNLDFEAIVGKLVKLAICQSDDKSYRYFNGFVSRFQQGKSDGQVAVYHATLVPWMWFLTQTRDCYIHQELTVDKIVKWVFDKFQFRDYEFQLRMQHDPWEYCTQYRESAFDFVSRLMEMEGIFYFWKQVEGRQVLMIGDGSHIHQPCPYQAKFKMERAFGRGFKRMEDSIYTFETKTEFKTGKYTYRENNFLTPDSDLQGETNARTSRRGKDKYEIYDYPGEYEVHGEANPFTRLRMEEAEVDEDVMQGTSCARSLSPGYKMEVSGHERRDFNKGYMVLEVEHEGHEENYLMEEEAKPPSYKNSFSCVPSDVPYRPGRKTPKHIMKGVQTATVVGPKGEEIYPDKYGRVKVQFNWDRVGKKDENSSCWIRVSQPWAGRNFGAMFLPRIGQEVIVDFVEGDPDRPIITGRVYNAANMPPYELPKNKNWSGIKSRSTKSGSPDNFNELRFDDTKGQELIWMHAEKDMRITVENDTDEIIDRDRKLRVKRDQIEEVEKEKHVKVGTNEFREVCGNQDTNTGGNLTEKIGGNRDMTIGGNLTAKIGGSIGLTFDSTVGAKVSGGLSLNTSTGLTLKDDMNVVIESGMSLTLKSSGGFISITPAGIFINGTMLFLNSGGAPTPATPAMAMSPKAPDPPKTPAKFGGENPYVTQAPAKTAAIPPPPPSQAKVSTPPPPPPPEAKFAGTPGYAPLAAEKTAQDPEAAKQKRAEFVEDLQMKAKQRLPEIQDPAKKKEAEAALERLQRNNKASEMAQLADAVHKDKPTPPGWERMSDDPAKLPPALKKFQFNNEQTGFAAAVFKSKSDGKVVAAFAGTDPKNPGALAASAGQAAGPNPEQYNKAMELGSKMKAAFPPDPARPNEAPFEMTGHSLGAALSSAVAAKTGQPATTFNPAALPKTMAEREGLKLDDAQNKVTNFQVEKEPLTAQQESSLLDPLNKALASIGQKASGSETPKGALGWLQDKPAVGAGAMKLPDMPPGAAQMPEAIGKKVQLPAVNEKGEPDRLSVFSGARHAMTMCINGLEKEKREDIETLSRIL
jgi:type VI secretion system secreted protein VgrG